MSGRWWARAHFAKKGHVTEMLMSRLPNPWLQKGEILWILCKGRFLVTHSCRPFHLKFGIELRTKSIVPFVRACPVLCTFFSLFSIHHPERLVASFYSVLDILVAEMRFHERTLAFWAGHWLASSLWRAMSNGFLFLWIFCHFLWPLPLAFILVQGGMVLKSGRPGLKA